MRNHCGYAAIFRRDQTESIYLIGLVLAAGEGSRLLPLTADRPKTLLEVGSSTILGHSLANLSAAGLSRVVIVAGDNIGSIEDWLRTSDEGRNLDIQVLQTGRDASWNNAFTLWVAREHMTESVIVANGDTVYPGVITRMLCEGHRPGITMAVDRSSALDQEEMKVMVSEDGRVTAIGKHLDPNRSQGEYIGISRIDGATASDVADALKRTFEQDRKAWYENGFDRYLRAGGEIHAMSIPDLAWVEVDTISDLEEARELDWTRN